MMKKTLMTAAALAAITAGASALGANKAEAGNFSLSIGFGGYGHGHGHGHFAPTCYTKYKAVTVKYWHHGWRWKTIWKPYTVCY